MTREIKNLLLSCAHESIGAALARGVHRTETGISADGLFGLFVTLWLEGSLRGCMGEIRPLSGDLGSAVARVARLSALDDPRFPPVCREEAGRLCVDISLLESPEPCTEADLDPQHYGVIVAAGARRGVLLPGIEGVSTAADQLAIARRKAGITLHESCDLQRFRITKLSDGRE